MPSRDHIFGRASAESSVPSKVDLDRLPGPFLESARSVVVLPAPLAPSTGGDTADGQCEVDAVQHFVDRATK